MEMYDILRQEIWERIRPTLFLYVLYFFNIFLKQIPLKKKLKIAEKYELLELSLVNLRKGRKGEGAGGTCPYQMVVKKEKAEKQKRRGYKQK